MRPWHIVLALLLLLPLACSISIDHEFTIKRADSAASAASAPEEKK